LILALQYPQGIYFTKNLTEIFKIESYKIEYLQLFFSKFKIKMEEVEPEETGPEKETTFINCKQCNQETKFSKKLTNAGLALCIRTSKCNKTDDVAKRICEFLGYKFLRVEKEKGKRVIIHFICNNGHECYLNFNSLRIGAKCTKCNREKRIKPKKEKIKRPNCGCPGSRLNKTPRFCPHYNHEIFCPESAQYWSKENNTTPDKI